MGAIYYFLYIIVAKHMIYDAAEDHQLITRLMKLKYPSYIPSLHRRTHLQRYICLYERDTAPKMSWWLIMDIAPTYLNHLTITVP